MADNDEVRYSTKISGDNISNDTITGPGEIKFNHKVGDVEIPNSIVIPQEYFQQDPIIIKLTSPLTTIKISDSVKLEFDITSGYPNSFAVLLSVEGDDNSKYGILAERVLYNFIDKKSSITFAVPDSPSKNCFVRIVGLDENDKILAVSNPSNEFEIVSPITNVTLTIGPIKKIVSTEDEITVMFELEPSQVEVDFFLVALNIDGNLHNPSRQVIKDPKLRSFQFKMPNQPGKVCQLGIMAVKAGSNIAKGVSKNFEIKSKGLNPPVNPEFNLISPKYTDDLHVDDTINIQFELIPETFITSNLNISYSIDNSTFTNIKIINNFSRNGSVPFTIPKCKQFWLRFNAQSVIKTFGPFTIGNKVVVEPFQITTTLTKLDELLNQGLSLPTRNIFARRNSKTLTIAQFAIDLVYADKSPLRSQLQNKIPKVINHLEELDPELENSNYKNLNPGNYNEFKQTLNDIEIRKDRFIKLNDSKRIEEMRSLASYSIEKLKQNSDFEVAFNKEFKTQLQNHTWEMIYKNKEKIDFIFVRREIAKVTAISHLYKFFEIYYDYLMNLDAQFNKIKRIISQIRKDIKPQ